MSQVVMEIEGSWEEVCAREPDLRGKHVRLQVLDRQPSDVLDTLRALLKDTQAQAASVIEEEIEAEVKVVRALRRCGS